MAHGRPVGEDDLHAHIDGQLPRERTEEVAAYLAAHPEIQARFSQYAAQRQALREALSAQADGAAPVRFRVSGLAAQQRRRRRCRVGSIAAAAGLFLLSGLGGWAEREYTAHSAHCRPERSHALSPPTRSLPAGRFLWRSATPSRSMPARRRISSSGCRRGLAVSSPFQISGQPAFG